MEADFRHTVPTKLTDRGTKQIFREKFVLAKLGWEN
jgi:hypothetical protein